MSALTEHQSERSRRLAKLDGLRERGLEPYPATYPRDHAAADLHGRFAGLAPDEDSGAQVRVAGRLTLIRHHGGLLFATLSDQTGSVQLLVSRETLGDAAFADAEALDRGDWVGAAGTVMATHTGELSVSATEVRLLSKALRALPDKHRGLTDTEARLRERHLDLIANPATRRTFDVRSAVVAAVRSTLVQRGFTEVETPVLEQSAGGANARPFVTHHNALDAEMYLRIALELPLKRLVVGGFERVFELGRVFRNEGLDASHNPEFTLLEAYQAFADYRDMMELVETIVADAALAATGTTVIEVAGRTVDLAPPWRRATMAELIAEHTGERMHPTMPVEAARAICDRLGVVHQAAWGAGRLMAEVYEATAEGTLIEPTFVLDHPREVSPLAKAHRDDPELTERFEAIVGGRELANAYSELNDPVDQRERFQAEGGPVDEDYVRALEYGLPPTGGLGIGIDRLVMLIAGVSSIREAVLFPALRPEHRADPEPTPTPTVVLDDDAAAPARSRAPRVIGALTGLGGLALLLEQGFGRLAHIPSIVAGVLLLVLAGRLGRAKRHAWAAGVALCCATALVRLSDPLVLLPAVAVLVALIWHRQAFAVRVRRAVAEPSAEERDRARELVRAHGTGTLDYFALRPDKRYFFTRAGDAMLAYRCLAGHALVSGDPIGDPRAYDRLLGEFVEHCRAHGLRLAFLGARERDLPLYRRHGLRSIYLGDEAVLHCDRFTLAGAGRKSVRSAVTRVGRECSFRMLPETEASGVLRDALNALRERWRDGEEERGFTMELGGGVRGEDPELLLAVAFAHDGRPLGFLRLVPCFGEERGWSLDLMQHDPDAPNGMTEYLIAMTAQELRARGDRRLSLNFATWGRLFAPDAELTVAQRAQRKLAQALSPYFQIRSLRDFNAKFDPEWVPRSIVVEDLADAPQVGLLYAAVEGFLQLPRLRR